MKDKGKIVLKVRKESETKDVTLLLNKGIRSLTNPFEAYKIVKELLKLDKAGWLIVGVDGEPPELVARFKSEMHIQSAKGEDKALKDIKDYVNPTKR